MAAVADPWHGQWRSGRRSGKRCQAERDPRQRSAGGPCRDTRRPGSRFRPSSRQGCRWKTRSLQKRSFAESWSQRPDRELSGYRANGRGSRVGVVGTPRGDNDCSPVPEPDSLSGGDRNRHLFIATLGFAGTAEPAGDSARCNGARSRRFPGTSRSDSPGARRSGSRRFRADERRRSASAPRRIRAGSAVEWQRAP